MSIFLLADRFLISRRHPPGETRSLLLRKRQILSRGFCCRPASITISAGRINGATPSRWREAIP